MCRLTPVSALSIEKRALKVLPTLATLHAESISFIKNETLHWEKKNVWLYLPQFIVVSGCNYISILTKRIIFNIIL